MTNLPHYFDSIKLAISVLDLALAEAAFPISYQQNRFKSDGTPRSSMHRQYLGLSTEYLSAPSWWTPPTIQFMGGKLWLEFSVPKFWYGHSAVHAGLDHLKLALQAWQLWFFEKRGIQTVPWPQWQVREIHFAYNFKMDSPEQVSLAEHQLARLRYRGKLSHRDKKRAYPYWPGAYRTIKFYQKGREMWTHRRKPGSHYDDDWLQARLYNLNRILRFEDEWRSKQLISFCGISPERKTGPERVGFERVAKNEQVRGRKIDRTEFLKNDLISQVTVSRFIQSLEKWTIKKHFGFIQSNFTGRSPVDNLELVRAQLKRLRRSSEYEQFLDAVLSRGLTQVKSELSNSTFYGRRKKFEKLGFPIEGFDTFGLVENFVGDLKTANLRTVDISPFIQYNNLCRDFDCENVCQDPIYLEAQKLVSDLGLNKIYEVV